MIHKIPLVEKQILNVVKNAEGVFNKARGLGGLTKPWWGTKVKDSRKMSIFGLDRTP